MSLRKIYIRYREDLPDGVNNFAALDGFQKKGVETTPFYGFGDIAEIEDLGPEVGLLGNVGDVKQALRMLNVFPESLDYPEELRSYLERTVWQSTMEWVRTAKPPFFVKPVEHKLFTGFEWTGSKADRLRLAFCESSCPVWVSDIVFFSAEFRAFVLNGEVLDVRRYRGSWKDGVSDYFLRGVIQRFKNPPAAYAIDVGLLGGMRQKPAIVEINDAFALGHYGLNSTLYANMIEARWEQLTTPATSDTVLP